MDALFPPLQPDRVDELDVGAGHRLYFELSGNPHGVPVVFLHGGPGSCSNPDQRRFFDPQHYRIVLYDQRGCGRSAPAGRTQDNTTRQLIDDLEQLRRHLGVDRWLLFGGSWGSTLGLAYAQAHPASTRGLILRGLFLGTNDEVAWFLEGLRRFVPEAWEALAAGVQGPSWRGLIAHYQARVEQGDEVAAQRWNAYEAAVMGVGEAGSTASPAPNAPALLARVRIQLHYLAQDCFLAPGQLLNGIGTLAPIPAILVQGRRDLVCPPSTAYALARAWPRARLEMVENGGHAAMHPAMSVALVRATEAFKTAVERDP